MDRSKVQERSKVFGSPLQDLLATDPRSLVVEIGCGVGLHPIKYAAQNPQKKIVAIERTTEKFQRFLGRLEAHPTLKSQICAVHGDAVHFLDQNFEDSSIDEVWLLYPNPEPKKPSRRWFRSPFMKRLVQLMKPTGRLYFATNLQSYADESVEFAGLSGLELIESRRIQRKTQSPESQGHPPSWQPRTHFEKKYFERGELLFDFQYRPRNDGAHS